MKNTSKNLASFNKECVGHLSSEEKKKVLNGLTLKPMLDFRFLYKSNKCLKNAYSVKIKNGKSAFLSFIDDFQKFIYEFANCKDFSDAKKLYSSHINGSNLKSKGIMNLIRRLPPDVSEAAKEDVDHLHIKRNGMGETVLIGFYVGVCFYIVGIDVNHELI